MVEHIHHHATDDSGSASLAVILVALLVIVGLAIFALRALPLQGNTGSSGDTDINVDLPSVTTPADTGTAQ